MENLCSAQLALFRSQFILSPGERWMFGGKEVHLFAYQLCGEWQVLFEDPEIHARNYAKHLSKKKTTQHKIRILGISQKLIQVLYFTVRAVVFESHSMGAFWIHNNFSMLWMLIAKSLGIAQYFICSCNTNIAIKLSILSVVTLASRIEINSFFHFN